MITGENYSVMSGWFNNEDNDNLTPIQTFTAINRFDEFEPNATNDFSISFYIDIDSEGRIADDLLEHLRATFNPVFQELVKEGLPQAVADALSASLATVHPTASAFLQSIDHGATSEDLLEVELCIDYEGLEACYRPTPTNVGLRIDFAIFNEDKDEFEDSEIIAVLFNGLLNLHIPTTNTEGTPQ